MARWYDKVRSWWTGEEPWEEEGPYIDVTPETEEGTTPEGFSLTRQRFIARLRKGSKRDQQIAALQAGYTELLELIRAIRGHLDNQAQSQDKLLNMLQHLPDAVDGLKGVGRTTEQQAEVLELLRKQLESSVDHDDKLVDSMNRFNETLAVMDQTSRSSAETMSRLTDRTRDSEEQLRGMLERSEKRLVALISVLGVVTLLVVAAGIYFGVTARKGVEYTPSAVPDIVRAPAVATVASVSASPQEDLASGLALGFEPDAEGEDVRGESVEPVADAAEEELEEPVAPSASRRGFLFFRRR
jgi:hypothetical protein